MRTSFFDTVIDFSLDILNFYNQRKLLSDVLVASLLLGSSVGYTSAALLPGGGTLESQHASAQKAITKIVPQTVAALPSPKKALSATELQTLYTQVLTTNKPELCTEKLSKEQVDSCVSNYWNITASLKKDASLCKNIVNTQEQEACNTKTAESIASIENTADVTPYSDQVISEKAGACMKLEGTKNQNICWNSLFLNVAVHNSAPEKCDNIKDETSKKICKSRASDAVYKKLLTDIKEKKDSSLCKSAPTEKQTQCLKDSVAYLNAPTENCKESCIDLQINDIALAVNDVSICKKSLVEADKVSCSDAVYSLTAKDKKDSSFCEFISAADKKTACKSAIVKTDDKNIFVQQEVFKASDRDFPQIGDTLRNPLLDTFPLTNTVSATTSSENVTNNPQYSSVLSDLQSLQQKDTAGIAQKQSLCSIYTSEAEKSACEDTIILQMAVPAKDVSQCQLIKNPVTEQNCELAIVKDDALKAAENAKQKCNMLSQQSLKEQCLRSLGFSSQTVPTSSSSDCLDYTDPIDRIVCMKDRK